MQTVGLHLEGDLLQLAKLRKSKSAIHLELLHTVSISDPDEVKRFYTILDSFLAHHTSLVTGLSLEETVCRELTFKIKSKRALMSAIPFQVENSLPYTEEETILCPLFYPHKLGETPVTLFATSVQHLQAHLEEWSDKRIDPDTVSTHANALKRFLHHFFPDLSTGLIFYVGDQTTTWCLIQNHRLCFSQSLPYGKAQLHNAVTANTTAPFKAEVKRALHRVQGFIQSKHPALFHAPVLYAGSAALFDDLEDVFGPSIATTKDHFTEALPYAIAFGLALDGLLEGPQSAQLRLGPFEAPKVKTRHRKLQTVYLGAALGLTLLFGSIQQVATTVKTRSFEKRVAALLNKELPLEEGIEALERATKASAHTYPYYPTVPTVTEVLHWASTHPKLTTESQHDTIDIQHLNYKLEKRPILGGKRERYEAFVEIELITSSPTLAREFHQTLLKGDALVNEKKEITWKANQNSYYTKFYLKGKKG